jgi:hypothetical protein
VADVRRAPQTGFALLSRQHDDRRFLADALRIAIGVAVEHYVPQHQSPRSAQAVENVHQIARRHV